MADKKTGTSRPSFTDLVPDLTGESNWQLWKKNLRIYLNSQDRSYWGILTGKDKRPEDLPGTPVDLDDADFDNTASIADSTTSAASTAGAKPPSASAIKARTKLQDEWDDKDCIILAFLALAVEPNMSTYVTEGFTSAMVYQELKDLCEANISNNTSAKAIKWINWKYKPGVKPEEFVRK
ncbi:hypothetical protein N7463_001316 [Penicillium fimorum]|uniref:Uncharacterized protein n=1 Tax=Penicillium fimorum TaxID=1882269 RepID=A0A9W9Y6W4_9EURO|nr:hypothetical protein N7463_001316 [Penicillium fimorum]